MAEKYFQQLKVINKIYKPNTAAYLMLVLDKHKYWASKPDNFYKQTNRRFTGHFYVSRSTFEKEINLKRTAQNTAERELKADGIIHMVPMEGQANWYTINHEMLQEKIDEYYWQQEENVEAVIDYPFDESEEYEEWIFGSDKAGQDDDNTQATPLKKDSPARLNHAATNNKELKIKNNNKVSKATYVPDGTESIDSCIKNINNSCIKEDSFVYRPPLHKTSDEVQQIVNEYNAAMGLKEATGDYAFVKAHLGEFKKIRKYLTPASIEYAWSNFSDKTARELEAKRLCVIDRYGVFKPFLSRYSELYTYFVNSWDNRLNKVFKNYRNLVDELVAPDKLHVNIIGELAFPSGETADGKGYRKKRIEIYKQHIEPKLLNDEDLEDMIIDLEVPEWIV